MSILFGYIRRMKIAKDFVKKVEVKSGIKILDWYVYGSTDKLTFKPYSDLDIMTLVETEVDEIRVFHASEQIANEMLSEIPIDFTLSTSKESLKRRDMSWSKWKALEGVFV